MNPIIYKKPDTTEENDLFRKIAIDENLYVKGWSLVNFLNHLDINSDLVVLAYEDKNPVGVCVVMGYGLTMFFVKDDYRGNGIASNFTKIIPKDENSFCLKGINGSEEFFKKSGLRLGSWDDVMDFYPM